MKLLFITVAIVNCISFAYAVTNPTASQISSRSSVIFFKAAPGLTEVYLAEEKQLEILFNILTVLGTTGKLSSVIAPLATDIKNAIAPINALKKDFIFLFIKNINTYATSQGMYNFPTSNVNDIVDKLESIVSILGDIQKRLTILVKGSNSIKFSDLYSTDISGVPLTNLLKLIGRAANQIQSFIAIFTNSPTVGMNTVVDLNALKKQSLSVIINLPNFNDLIPAIIKGILNPTN